MTVVRTDTGWAVIDDDGGIVQMGFETNAAAWRWLDRFNCEPISRSEVVADWVSRKMAGVTE
jgi:hypothetical protein